MVSISAKQVALIFLPASSWWSLEPDLALRWRLASRAVCFLGGIYCRALSLAGLGKSIDRLRDIVLSCQGIDRAETKHAS